MNLERPPHISPNILLAPWTTIGLGGTAQWFAECNNDEQVRDALRFARTHRLSFHILGGGSNTIFADEGFAGLVLRVAHTGLTFEDDGDCAVATVAAGIVWDEFVQSCLSRGLAGIECLSGIPGCVGATPIQNVGAYGQEVSDTILFVTAIDVHTFEEVKFRGSDCGFGYRESRFKSSDADKYIITGVTFRLRKDGRPDIRYPELRACVESSIAHNDLQAGEPSLASVRNAVLALRKKKSMVIDAGDPDSRSVGSFYVNPVLSVSHFKHVQDHWRDRGHPEAIPTFASGPDLKIPAAWLVEHSGFRKGYRKGNVGISRNHALALVNYGGSTRELLALSCEIEAAVLENFSIRLRREPVVVTP